MPIVGVAGSNGKTTVKEMIAAILERAGNTLATRGNLNNHIGVPLTLHRLDATHRYAVVEIGANRAGEVADLVKTRAAYGGPHHQRRRRASRGLRQHGRRRARRRRNGRGPRRLRHRGDQCRRRLRRPVARHDARARSRRSEWRSPRIFRRPTCIPRSAPTVSSRVSRCVRRRARCPSSCTWRAGTTCSTRCAPRPRPPQPARRSTTSAPALPQCARFLADCSSKPRRVAPGSSTTLITPIPSSMKAGIEVLASVDARRWLVMGDMGELGTLPTPAMARSAASRAITASIACSRPARCRSSRSRPSVRAREWFADTEALARAVNAELTREVCVLVKGSRMNRLERVVEALIGDGTGASSQEPTEHMLYWLAKLLTPHYSGFNVFSYLTVRAIFAVITGLALGLLLGPVDDREAQVRQGRPGGARRRSEVAFLQGRHADDGRHADPHRDLREHAAVVRPAEPLRVGRARRDVHVRPDRLLGRLPQAREEESQGPDRALQVFLAVAVRARRRHLPVLHREDSRRDHALSTVLQELRGADGRRGLRPAVVFHDRRHEQRGEPHRRARRPRDHAVGHGGRRARRVRVCQRQRELRAVPVDSRGARRRRTADLLRRAGRRRASGSSGSTPIPRRCSWATSARWRSAPRSARSP